MAMQVQRPKVQTVTTPSETQSLNLVRNLLGTTIGAIAYLRMLLPEDNFKDTSLNGMALKSLVRGYSIEADELIDWVERGLFDALEKQYLRTMIFGIYLNENEPEKLVEAYTFHFSYPARDLWCITVDAAGKDTFKLRTKDEIMKATSDMLRRLLLLTQTLRPLPENAYITMKIYYYDNITPADYEPPLFRAGDDDRKFYFEAKQEKIHVGTVKTPHHAVKLQVQTATDGIQPTDLDVQAMEIDEEDQEFFNSDWSQDGPLQMPLQERESTRVAAEVKSQSEQQPTAAQTEIPTPVTPTSVAVQIESMNINNLDVNSDDPMDVDPPRSLPEISPLSSISKFDSTPRLSTPVVIRNSPRRKTFARAESSKRREPITPNKLQISSPLTGVDTTGSTQDLIAQLRDGSKYGHASTPSKAKNARASPPEGSSKVAVAAEEDDEDLKYDCPCGVQENDGDCIECEGCRMWNHVVCFGFKALDDPRIPEHHFCYKCQNGRAADGMVYDLEKAAEVAIFRRGLFVIWEEGLESIAWFAERLGVGLDLATQLVNRLRGAHFITHAKVGHSKKRSCGPTSYAVVRAPKARASYNRWFSDAVLPKQNPDVPVKRGRPRRQPTNESKLERSSSGTASEGGKSDRATCNAADIVMETATDNDNGAKVAQSHLPTPATMDRRQNVRGSLPPADTTTSNPSSPGRRKREFSASSMAMINKSVLRISSRATRSMSAALVATGEADTSPAGGKSQNGASGDTAVRRKFLDQFEVTNDTQMTGFDPERDFTAPVRGRSLTDDMSTKRKKRKVSVVGRGIPVL